VKYAFIDSHRSQFAIIRMCDALGVSESGYHAWRDRPPSRREQEDAVLLEKIREIHQRYRQACGSDKTWYLLNADGVTCGRHRVARLRRSHGIEAIRMNRFRSSYAARNSDPASDNVLNRQFKATRPDQVWVTDTTFIPTRQGILFLAIVIDLYARQVVGWAMSASNNKQLVCDALNMAVTHRQPMAGLLHHSDRGSTYTSAQYKEILMKHGIVMSMSRIGNCHDNAVAESFFANLKNELTFHRDFRTRQEAKSAIFDYIELFYNRKRPHQTLKYASPVEYETMCTVA
jgi:transposase InsO family protein